MKYIKMFLFFSLFIQGVFASQENMSLRDSVRLTNLKNAEERLNLKIDPLVFDDVVSILKYLKECCHWSEEKMAQKFEVPVEEVRLLVNDGMICTRLTSRVHNYYIQGGISLVASGEKEYKWWSSLFETFCARNDENNKSSKVKSY